MNFLQVLQVLMLALMAVSAYFTVYYFFYTVKNISWANIKDLLFSVCTLLLCLVVTGAIQLNTITGIF